MRSAPSVWLAIPLLALTWAAPAAAGPLAQTANAVDNKVETNSSSDSSPSPPPDSDPPPPQQYDDNDCTGCSSSTVVVGAGAGYYASGGSYQTVGSSGPSQPLLPGPGRLDLYLGAHSVVDSDHALLGELRAAKDWIGLGVSGIRYVEHVEDGKREDDVSVHLTTISISGRVFRHDATEFWLDGGLAWSGSSEYDTILGTAWSLRGEHAFTPDLGVRAQVRYYALEYEVSATEGWAGLNGRLTGAWFLQAGYRALKFNVGPPLHGPEAGVALRF